jgi:hypothetical protein
MEVQAFEGALVDAREGWVRRSASRLSGIVPVVHGACGLGGQGKAEGGIDDQVGWFGVALCFCRRKGGRENKKGGMMGWDGLIQMSTRVVSEEPRPKRRPLRKARRRPMRVVGNREATCV